MDIIFCPHDFLDRGPRQDDAPGREAPPGADHFPPQLLFLHQDGCRQMPPNVLEDSKTPSRNPEHILQGVAR